MVKEAWGDQGVGVLHCSGSWKEGGVLLIDVLGASAKYCIPI